VLSLVLALAVASFAGVPSASDDALRSTVTIGGTVGTSRDGNEVQFGAGEILAQRADGTLLVLTARHVVAHLETPRVFLHDDVPLGSWVQRFFSSGAGRDAAVVALAPDTDLALIAFRPEVGDRFAIARFGDADPAQGTIVGDPYGAAWTTSAFALISGENATLIVRCARCGPGDSGGGVFDADGRLTGIVTESQDRVVDGHPVATGIFRAIALTPIRRFVASAGTPTTATPTAPLLATRGITASDAWARFHAARSGP
jgi:S1-C subfamily serine protease